MSTGPKTGKQFVALAVTVVEIVAPVFLLAALGFCWVKLGFDYPIAFVTRLAMSFGIPCLIFVSLMQAQVEPAALRDVSLATVVAYAGVSLAMIGLVFVLRLSARTYLTPLTFANTGNIGLPLCLFAFGAEGLSYAIIMFAIMAIWNFTYGLWIVTGGGTATTALKEPMVWATLLGGLFLWQGWDAPRVLTNTLELIGQLAIPLMLITLGVAVASLSPSGVGRALWLSCLKLIICAAIGWVVGRYFGLNPIAFGVLVLQLATPVAVTSYLLAEKYDAGSSDVAGLVVVSTLLSVAAMPIVLALVL